MTTRRRWLGGTAALSGGVALRGLGGMALAARAGTGHAAEPTTAKAPLEVAFVYVTPRSAYGWTHQHDLAREAVAQALGERVRVRFVENVPEGPDAERVMRDLAREGVGLIFGTSFGYGDPMRRVAREFPKVRFEHCSGLRRADNLSTYNARYDEGRYLSGLIAGRASQSGVLGVVAGMPIPEVIQGINAFTLGARSVNPSIRTRVIFVHQWFDPGAERDAALTLIGQKADVLTHHSGSGAVAQAAEEKDVWMIGYQSDVRPLAPKKALVSIGVHWAQYCIARTRAVLDGTWTSGDDWGGLSDGRVRLDGLNHGVIPQSLQKLVSFQMAQIGRGERHVWGGPVRTREGVERVAEGAVLSAEALRNMDWLVEGVQGSI